MAAKKAKKASKKVVKVGPYKRKATVAKHTRRPANKARAAKRASLKKKK